MATLYFYDSTGVGDWHNSANWYTGAYSGGVPTGHANRIPTASDNVVIGYSGNTDWQHLSILTNTGSTAVCNTLDLWGNNDIDGNSVVINIEVNNSGMATFHEYTINVGTIDNNATFNDYSFNNNIINGDAVFNGYSANGFNVNGSATFNDYSINNNGTVSGTTIFNYPAYIGGVNGGTSLGGVILAGSYPFKQDSSYWYWFNFSGDDDYNNWANWVYWGGGHSSSVWESSVDHDTPYTIGGSPNIILGLTTSTLPSLTGISSLGFGYNAVNQASTNIPLTFYNSSSNGASITGGATFNDSSVNNSTVTGGTAFNNNSYNASTVDSAIFSNSSYNAVGAVVTGTSYYFNSTVNKGISNSVILFNGSSSGSTATDTTGYASGIVIGQTTVYPHSTPITSWIFSSTSLAADGTVTGSASFQGSRVCNGTVNGSASFVGTTQNNGTINGSGSFSGSSVSSGTVTGVATFSGTSQNQGTISGVGTFSESSISSGIVVGNATFNGASYNTGVIQSNGYFHSTQSSSGTIDGNAYVYTPYPYPFSATVLGTIYYYGYNFIPGVVLNTSTIGATVTTPLNTSTIGTTISVVLSA